VPEYFRLKGGASRSFDGFGAYYITGSSLSGSCQQPIRVTVGYTTASGLAALGVQPKLGRLFNEGEDRPGAYSKSKDRIDLSSVQKSVGGMALNLLCLVLRSLFLQSSSPENVSHCVVPLVTCVLIDRASRCQERILSCPLPRKS